mmetsp:Transcript_5739/g.14303  ORF Transcript_5739/g.14303 Transcript_5739/m.14303 type:complete len:240 (+) Transcript_5739:856-1575(+)
MVSNTNPASRTKRVASTADSVGASSGDDNAGDNTPPPGSLTSSKLISDCAMHASTSFNRPSVCDFATCSSWRSLESSATRSERRRHCSSSSAGSSLSNCRSTGPSMTSRHSTPSFSLGAMRFWPPAPCSSPSKLSWTCAMETLCASRRTSSSSACKLACESSAAWRCFPSDASTSPTSAIWSSNSATFSRSRQMSLTREVLRRSQAQRSPSSRSRASRSKSDASRNLSAITSSCDLSRS